MTAVGTSPGTRRIQMWVLVLLVLAAITVVPAILTTADGGLLPDRVGPPVEALAVERTTLKPGTIELTIRNTGPDPVHVVQVSVNDTYVDFVGAAEPIGRLRSERLNLYYPWVSGQPYTVSILTSTGLVIEHTIAAAVTTPEPGADLIWVMTILGACVGVIPVALGMLVLPALRRVGRGTIRVLLAVTVGLLGFLAVDAAIEGLAVGGLAGEAFGGPRLVLLGAGLAFLGLTAIDRMMDRRRRDHETPSSGLRLALMIAIGIGLHNAGEGLAIGSAYAIGELAVGTALVVGFALHNTTEGLAIVAPLASQRPPIGSLILLGAVAGVPVIPGAVIGVAIDNAALSAVLLGIGVGAIVQVIIQISRTLRGRDGRLLEPGVVAGLAAGAAVMYLTGLLVPA
jgi:zinc transporter, ZIP family